ncbi:MAG: hypothetical protein PHD45_02960 [Bacteroidales bacterium]|nr:hypothetical protein [Bacteroidales bacterium]
MKKIKQFSLKAMLLTIVAALTIGFTGCSDELSGDQTQGKPGYLTLNLKTLKPLQSKVSGDGAGDYQIIKDLNIFVFDGTSHGLLLNKYFTYATSITDGTQTENISVNSLPANAYVVVVANNGSRIDDITTYSDLEEIEIVTVRNFEDLGLHMTGKANIETSTDGYSYKSNVNIAPVESKITVNWTLTDDVLANYNVTGIYIVNAINKTTLPIIRDHVFTPGVWAAASDVTIASNINPATRTASTGLVPQTPFTTYPSDYNFYTGLSTVEEQYLKDEVLASDLSGEVLIATPTSLLSGSYHYYMGENYSDISTLDAGDGGFITNASANANTLVVVRITPKSTAPEYIRTMGHKYYTYAFKADSDPTNNAITGIIADGFSVRRKTNYTLTFTLSNIGTDRPFERIRSLQVNVEADPWDPATAGQTF